MIASFFSVFFVQKSFTSVSKYHQSFSCITKSVQVCMQAFSTNAIDELGGKVDPNIILPLLPNCAVPLVKDLICISERQLDHKVSDIFAIDKVGCRHGYPRAFIQYPVGEKAMSSGMLRLSCPHLVKAVDKFEDEGGIDEFNSQLNANMTLQSEFLAINNAWAAIRTTSTSETDRTKIRAVLGKETELQLMTSGIIGITVNKVDDVKCLHAHVADAIVRGEENNIIGSMTLQRLQKRGVPVTGCEECKAQCDSAVPKKQGWWYTPAKNKQKLRTTKNRRLELRSASGRASSPSVGDN